MATYYEDMRGRYIDTCSISTGLERTAQSSIFAKIGTNVVLALLVMGVVYAFSGKFSETPLSNNSLAQKIISLRSPSKAATPAPTLINTAR